ncbi:hypothetical protein EGW08_003585 [Elysia chlorotica]|uniref:Peptidase S1 domain-containing protein n=1 Tax=Elysia chlorotica TaxID=188477 RepID=A0A433U481_ELYCH|nr:hypothetical protein EGW08_003585 [Elysia chlorotica]
MAQGYIHTPGGQHECEILGSGPEAEESQSRWKECQKNPGHEQFISARYFKDNCLPRIKNDGIRDRLRAGIDLTVRLRVNWTSPGRPDGDIFSHARGSNELRVGTGFISLWHRKSRVLKDHCDACRGETAKKSWGFSVQTARHVVYDTEEAKETKVDLFYDDDSCTPGGGRETMRGLAVVATSPGKDTCHFLCVTHDEKLADRIESALRCWWRKGLEPLKVPDLDFLTSWGSATPVLIVSHPHGQAKKITVGEQRYRVGLFLEYNTATCAGSSGAPVFATFCLSVEYWSHVNAFPSVHSGGFITSSPHLLTRFLDKIRGRKTKQDQINYGFY